MSEENERISDDLIGNEKWKQSQELELEFQLTNPAYAPKRDEITEENIHHQKSLLALAFSKFGKKLSFFNGKDIIEIGGGPRGSICFIGGFGKRVGVDPLFDDLRKKDVLLETENIELHSIKAEDINFQRESFDLAICINAIDHVHKPRLVLQKINRILKPSGLLFLSVNIYKFYTIRLFSRILKRVDPTHPHHFSQRMIIDETQLAGFGIKNQELNPLGMRYGNFIRRTIANLVVRNLWLELVKVS